MDESEQMTADDYEDRIVQRLEEIETAVADGRLDHLRQALPSVEEQLERLTAISLLDIVKALAEANPVYDDVWCFFCYAEPRSESHKDNCPWWMARRLLGMSAWPEEE